MKRWSLSTKIYFLIGILIFAAALISYMAVTRLETLNESMLNLVNGPVKRQKQLLDIQGSFFLQQVNEKNLLLANNDDERRIHEQRFKDRHEKIMEIYNDVYPNLILRNQENLRVFMEAYNEFLALHSRIEKLMYEKKIKEAAELSMVDGRAIRLKAEDKMKMVMDVNVELVNKTVKNGRDLYETAKFSLTLLSLLSIFLSAGLAFFVLKSVSGAIKNVIHNLNANSAHMNMAAKKIATSSEHLSQATTEQAASIEQTAASIEQMNTMVQKNADNARKTSLISINSNQSALKGKEVVSEMIRAIEDISESNEKIMEQIEKSNQQITEIVEVISEIGNKTKVINDIVFQTKLLSFNASVESARAGEHGKGFAVVAEEVGNLAQISGKASQEISTMLEASIHKVQSIVDETRRSVDSLVHEGKLKVDTGTKIAQQCGNVLEEIVNNVSMVSGMADEISSSCQEQALGVQEITKAIHQLDQVTQANAQTSVHTSHAADDLSSEANSLKAQVDSLVVTVMGENEMRGAA